MNSYYNKIVIVKLLQILLCLTCLTSLSYIFVNSFPLNDNNNVNINVNINFDTNLYYDYDIRDYDKNEELIPCDNIKSFYSDAFIVDYKILYSIKIKTNKTKSRNITKNNITKNNITNNTIMITNNNNNNNDTRDNNDYKCADYYNSLYDYIYYKNNVKMYFADDTRNIENSKFGLHNNIKCANIQKLYHGVIRLKYQTLSHCGYTCDMFVIVNQQNITIINTYIKTYYNIKKKLHLTCNHTHCTHRQQFTCIANNNNQNNNNNKNEL